MSNMSQTTNHAQDCASTHKFEFNKSSTRHKRLDESSEPETWKQRPFCWKRILPVAGTRCGCCRCNNAETGAMTKTSKTKQQTTESQFYKFLGRFSGRRRYHHLQRTFHTLSLTITSILILISLCSVTEACSSRTTPKPRPPPTTTPRPNITFHTYKCPPAYAAWYCLNEATCFTVKIGDEILYNCECADGYMGPRCEYKDLDGSYLPTRPRVMLETASIASGATLALVMVLILCLVIYVKCHQRRKLERLAEDVELDVDTVDGPVHVALRPFGPHHTHTIPISAIVKR